MMSKYIKIEDLRLHLQNLVLNGGRLDPKTTRLIIMTLRELPIHEFDDECENGQTTNDCISRKQAIEAVTNTIREKFSLADWYEQLVETGLEIENLIKELPPVTPTERIGEWVDSKGEPVDDNYSVYCSRCKAWSEYRDIYCGNCGAKMGGDDNE